MKTVLNVVAVKAQDFQQAVFGETSGIPRSFPSFRVLSSFLAFLDSLEGQPEAKQVQLFFC